jgi:PAS domain S-box-containing protein
MYEVISAAIITLGIASVLVAIWETRKLFHRLQNSRHVRSWKISLSMMIVLLLGQALALLAVVGGHMEWTLVLASVVFLFNGLFAWLVQQLGLSIIKDLQKTNSNLRDKEVALSTSEAYFRHLIENSSDGLSILSPDGVVLYISPATERMTGLKAEDVIHHHFSDFIHPADLEATAAILATLQADPSNPVMFTARFRHQNGSWRTLELITKVLADGRLVSNYRDVTERKQIETALRVVAAGTAATVGDGFLQSLVGHLATALDVRYALIAERVEVDRVRTVAMWNGGQLAVNVEYALAGTPCEGVIGRQELCYYPAQLQELFPADEMLVELAAESYMGVPLVDSAGRVLGHMAVLDDRPMRDEAQRRSILQIFAARTAAELERQQAQEELRTSEAYYRSLIENVSDGISIVGTDGRIEYVNPAYERIWGWTAEEIMGRSFAELIHPADLTVAYDGFARVLENPGIVNAAEVRAHHKNGSWRVLEGLGKALPDGRLVTNTRDVTERRQMENALRAMVEGTAATGNDFFNALVQHLASALQVKYAFVTTCQTPPESGVRMLAFWDGNGLGPNYEYELSGAPCQCVIEQGEVCLFSHDVPARFPEDEWLAEIGVQSYLGIPLFSATGKVLGHLAVMDERPMQEELRQNAILRIFAVRAGAELERQQAEEALRHLNEELEERVVERTAELTEANGRLQAEIEERSRLVAILEATSDIVGTADAQGNILYTNQAGQRFFGWNDVNGKTLADVYPDHVLALREKEMMIHAADWDNVAAFETVVKRADSQEVPVSLVGTNHRSADGTILRSVILRDISDHKRAEMELKQAKEAAETALAQSSRLTEIIEATTDLVGTADMNGEIRYLNRSARQALGFGEDEPIQGVTMADIFAPAAYEPLIHSCIPQAIEQGTMSFETAFRARDGREIPCWEVGIVHRSADGTPQYMSGVARDITERKRVEAELQAAKESAEAASRAKSTFLANMSHEIRTPMNAVIGMTGLLLNTALDSKQRDFVETIRSAGDSLLTIINDILDFSKIEAGKLELECQPFDLRDCVESALDLLATRAAEKGLEIAYLMDEDIPAGILGDVTRLRQVLVNLISNAIKFTKQGEVIVTIRPKTTANSYQLHFAVQDTGIGIARERMGRLFQSFSQLDASTTREYGGTGLGLAISKRLVELMGGQMWVESDGLDQGATFHFTVSGQATAVPPRRHLQPNALPELKGKRLLLVDDNHTNRRILSMQAKSWGMEVEVTATPSEALSLIQQGQLFDLAILDMYMPEMDGLALAAAIRHYHDSQSLPLVMLTSVYPNDEPGLAQFAAFLTKPVKPSNLYDLLLNIFAIQATAAPLPEAAGSNRPLADQLPLRILLVEDVLVNQKFALQALEEMGYQADVAANGVEAVAAVQRQPYDVVLMDVQMPVMDGLEATRRIHKIWAEATISAVNGRPYIVAMTANALQGDREACLAAGMDDYISKPVYLEELQAALKRVPPLRPAAALNNHAELDELNPTPLLAEDTLTAVLRQRNGASLLQLYLEEAAGLLAAVQAAVEQDDAAGLRQAAHSLKGSSAYVGAQQVMGLSALIEQHGRDGAIRKAARLMPELAKRFAHTRQVLQTRSRPPQESK